MGWAFFPVYGEDLGSAVENADKVIGKMKTNKFDRQDLVEFKKTLEEVVKAIKTEIAKNND